MLILYFDSEGVLRAGGGQYDQAAVKEKTLRMLLGTDYSSSGSGLYSGQRGRYRIGPRPASRPAQLLHRDEDVLVHHYNNTLDHNIHCYDDHDHETMGMRPWVMGSVLVHP